jgi:hypothetical protein
VQTRRRQAAIGWPTADGLVIGPAVSFLPRAAVGPMASGRLKPEAFFFVSGNVCNKTFHMCL